MRQLEFFTETLESRLLLAGNVAARVTAAGNLVIKGDAGDNQIAIVAGETSDQIMVIGTDTSLNKGPNVFVANGVTGDIRIRLRAGNDRLEIGPGNVNPGELGESFGVLQFEGLLKAHLGSGNDVVEMVGQTTVGLDGSRASESMRLGSVFVQGQGGDDVYSVQDLVMTGDLRFFDTTGDDVVSISNIDMEGENCEIDVATCGGEDEICFEGEFAGMDVRVRAGTKEDTLLGREVLPEDADITGIEHFGSHDE